MLWVPLIYSLINISISNALNLLLLLTLCTYTSQMHVGWVFGKRIVEDWINEVKKNYFCRALPQQEMPWKLKRNHPIYPAQRMAKDWSIWSLEPGPLASRQNSSRLNLDSEHPVNQTKARLYPRLHHCSTPPSLSCFLYLVLKSTSSTHTYLSLCLELFF